MHPPDPAACRHPARLASNLKINLIPHQLPRMVYCLYCMVGGPGHGAAVQQQVDAVLQCMLGIAYDPEEASTVLQDVISKLQGTGQENAAVHAGDAASSGGPGDHGDDSAEPELSHGS